MPVTYQSVEFGKGSNGLYKNGSKVQQCSAGADGVSTYKLPVPQTQSQSDLGILNLMTSYSMYFRPQSPDSKNCCNSLGPLNLPGSLQCSDGGEEKSPVSPLFSSLSSLGGAADGLTSSDDGGSAGGHPRADSKCWGSASSCFTDSIGQVYDDEKNCSVVDLAKSAIRHEDASKSLHNFYAQQSGLPSLLNLQDTGPELSSSSSSIGNRSDDSAGSVENEDSDMEVESKLRAGPLDMMSELECSLPIKRGLSRFWSGKSKSFHSLAEVSSVNDLAKPENPFNKRRRYTTFADRHRSFPPLSRSATAGISKKPPSGSGKCNLAMAVAMGSKLECSQKSLANSVLPPAARSFSLVDLHHASNILSPPSSAPASRLRRS
ncbi:hypothetical protein R1flu_029313 [Riccia fluitans]|uniref:Uncharacterized protein n=1 Tax=Riccia fluitans TaxID=41844 RepID=A0ABD1XP89_9MARC